MKILYAKYELDRRPECRIETRVIEEGGRRTRTGKKGSVRDYWCSFEFSSKTIDFVLERVLSMSIHLHPLRLASAALRPIATSGS